MVYAVIDTNVLVSALLTQNQQVATRRVLDLLINKTITPLYNVDVITEYRDVLNRPKFSFNTQEVDTLIRYIVEIGENTERTSYNDVMLDEDDRVFYEISLTKEDSFLVTGNIKHFPQSTKIVTPAEFIEKIELIEKS